MMFDVKKLSILSILGSVLLASTCVQAMPEETMPEETFAQKRARIAAFQLAKKDQKPAVNAQKPVVPVVAPGQLVVPAGLENLGAAQAPVVQPVPQGPVEAMKKGAPPPPPGKFKTVKPQTAIEQAPQNGSPVAKPKEKEVEKPAYVEGLGKALSEAKLRKTPQKVADKPAEEKQENLFRDVLRHVVQQAPAPAQVVAPAPQAAAPQAAAQQAAAPVGRRPLPVPQGAPRALPKLPVKS